MGGICKYLNVKLDKLKNMGKEKAKADVKS